MQVELHDSGVDAEVITVPIKTYYTVHARVMDVDMPPATNIVRPYSGNTELRHVERLQKMLDSRDGKAVAA